ncbi:hypothetical protein Tco_0700891, partial [Tanacetum coccineum]
MAAIPRSEKILGKEIRLSNLFSLVFLSWKLLPNMKDRWFWSLSGTGEFTAASARQFIDDHLLPEFAESTNHIFYDCYMVRDIYRKIASWWDVSSPQISSYEEWEAWILSLNFPSK